MNITIHWRERSGYHSSLINGEPLFFSGIQVQARKLSRHGRNPCFTGNQNLYIFGPRRVKPLPWRFLDVRIALKWETILAIL